MARSVCKRFSVRNSTPSQAGAVNLLFMKLRPVLRLVAHAGDFERGNHKTREALFLAVSK
jgi:hypothetical protein